MKHTETWVYRLWAYRQEKIKLATAHNKLSEELLRETATVLKKWSKEHHTSGYQHGPMEVLSAKIFRHIDAPNKALNHERAKSGSVREGPNNSKD